MADKLRQKVYDVLGRSTRHHISPVNGEINARWFPVNPIFTSATYFIDGTQLMVGDPGSGKTTSAKIYASMYSGMPYDLLDSTEMRGNPHAYEEKVIGRFDYHLLQKQGEVVIWKAGLAMPIVMADEANWLPEEVQAAILQGIETGRWNYGNETLFEGKKPTYLAINKRDDGKNGFIPALADRTDICLVFDPISIPDMLGLRDARDAARQDLYNQEYTDGAMGAIREGFERFREYLRTGRPIKGGLTEEEKAEIKRQIRSMPWDDDSGWFLQAFAAEINVSNQYGWKRSLDPVSQETHDMQHAGVNVHNPMSNRNYMGIEDYASAVAWLLGDPKVTADHVKFVLPYTIHHRLRFTDAYRDAHGSQERQDMETLHLAKQLVAGVDGRFTTCINPSKTLLAKIQRGELSDAEIMAMSVDRQDHPLKKEMLRKAQEEIGRKPFYLK